MKKKSWKYKADGFAQIDPEIRLDFLPKTSYKLKGGKKYVMIVDYKSKTFKIEHLWWFDLKNWIRNKIFN